MTALAGPQVPPADEAEVLAAARAFGFALVQCETDTGRIVWEWRPPEGPRPQFATRPVAVDWMRALLEYTQQPDDRVP